MKHKFTPAVAAIALIVAFFPLAGPVFAQTSDQTVTPAEDLDALFAELKQPLDGDWRSVENRIWRVWSHSGSASMDFLLERGRDATRAGDFEKAVEHLTALTDHAPEFAEGWNARATVYFMMDKYGLAIADIQRTLALNPRHFGAMSGLAMIFERLDQPKKALEVYRKAHSIHPLRPDILKAIKRLEDETQGVEL
ncbi:MAG: tetratricopeptide repeat protein [Alphaproteobacteria bacterium]|nr:tetratricopeptide repeat protein [Alphaproteobacteria bacterium]